MWRHHLPLRTGNLRIARYDVTVVLMTQRSVLDYYRRFQRNCYLHLQCRFLSNTGNVLSSPTVSYPRRLMRWH